MSFFVCTDITSPNLKTSLTVHGSKEQAYFQLVLKRLTPLHSSPDHFQLRLGEQYL